MKKSACRGPKFANHQNLFDSWTESGLQEWQHVFFKRACRDPQQLPPTRKRPVFVFERPTRPSSAGKLSQELGDWFCPLNLRLPSGTDFGDRQGLELGLKLELCRLSRPDQRIVKVLSAQKPQHKLCGVWILFKPVTEAKFEPKEVNLVKFRRLMPQTGHSTKITKQWKYSNIFNSRTKSV